MMQLAAGEHHSLALHKDGSVSAWGRGDYSQLGLGELDPLCLSLLVCV